MKVKIQVVIETEGSNEVVQEVVQLNRGALRVEEFGLTLAEAKTVLRGVQQTMVEQQSAQCLAQQACCWQCGSQRLQSNPPDCVSNPVWQATA